MKEQAFCLDSENLAELQQRILAATETTLDDTGIWERL